MRAVLLLEDGRSFWGQTDMRILPKMGRVAFDTRVVGYQEVITDTVNAGRLLVLTYPLIGNYGVAEKFNESSQAWPGALIIKEKSAIVSNWQAEESLDKWARKLNLPIIYGMDTRTLAVYLRQKGEMLGVVSSSIVNSAQLLKYIRQHKKAFTQQNWLNKTSLKKMRHLGKNKRMKAVVLDLGISRSMLKQLESLKLNISVVPYNTKAEQIIKLKPKAVIISNGPEGSTGLKSTTATVKALLGRVPVLGIATGAQVLALSLGAKIKSMHLGHHGVNYPVKSAGSLEGNITIQSHSYVIDAKSLGRIKGVDITRYNLNDNSVEEFTSRKLGILGVQYYPLSPGFREIHPVLKRFVEKVRKNA
ncbi:carbamoyl phosphate synthase small subunit [Candidatus Omnitrophota bacterium]